MSIHQLNHAVLYVRDVDRSAAFYRDVLRFETAFDWEPGAAFLRAEGSTNDHDLALFGLGAQAAASGAGRGTVGLYHLAWEVETLRDLQQLAGRLAEAGALVGVTDHGTTKSLYGHDPDGLEFEIVWIVPADLLGEGPQDHGAGGPLDLDREIERYGADTPGGYGISRPAVGAGAVPTVPLRY